MREEILKIRIHNEQDIVFAYRRAKQLCEFCGMNVASQTKFATAVSEICRNVLEHVGEGHIGFSIIDHGNLYLDATVTDSGRGIINLEEVLSRDVSSLNAKGTGIANSRKLVDQFLIESTFEKGTKVKMRKMVPFNHPPINKSIIAGWIDYFEKESTISPYEELKKQNMHYLEVTETLKLKKMESEMQLEEIKRLNIELDRFSYTIAHDLKAPLNKMQSLVTILHEDMEGLSSAGLAGTVGMIEKQVQGMQNLILEILSYSKKGNQHIKKSLVNVNELIDDVLQTLKVPQNLDLTVGKMPLLFTEAVFMYQIFSNLISNALKYNDKAQCAIQIECSEEEEGFVFSVEDNGPGVAPKDQERIFRLFEGSSKTARESTGVGLSIVQNIIDEKKARIWVESDGEMGAKFCFLWPEKRVKL